MDKNNIIKELQKAHNEGLKIGHYDEFKAKYSKVLWAIGKHKYSLEDICKEANVPYNGKQSWNPDKVKRELDKHIKSGFPLSVSQAKQTNNPLVIASAKHFGSWRKALESFGINYDEVDQGDASRKSGRTFENFVSEIFDELKIKYRKHPRINNCVPDFVFDENHWCDVKLSEWTIDDPKCDTVAKYLQHVDKLDIIYLRGNKERDEFINDNVQLTSVYSLIDKIKDEDKREIFKNKADYIWKQAEKLEFIGEYDEDLILKHLLEAHEKGIILRLVDLKENGYGRLAYAIGALKLSLPELRRKLNIKTKQRKKEDGYWKNKNNIINEALELYKNGISLTSYQLIKLGHNSLVINICKNWKWNEFREIIESKYKEEL